MRHLRISIEFWRRAFKSCLPPGSPNTELLHSHSTIRHAECPDSPGRLCSSTPRPLLLSMPCPCRWLILAFLCSIPCAAQAAQPVHYLVDLTAPETHLVQVTMN